MAPQSKAHIRAANKYNHSNYDRININVLKGERDRLKALAAAQGKSLNQYVVDAIDAADNQEELLKAYEIVCNDLLDDRNPPLTGETMSEWYLQMAREQIKQQHKSVTISNDSEKDGE